jgi:hypothetical protein
LIKESGGREEKKMKKEKLWCGSINPEDKS